MQNKLTTEVCFVLIIVKYLAQTKMNDPQQGSMAATTTIKQ